MLKAALVKPLSLLLKTSVATGALVGTSALLLYTFQDKLLYYPSIPNRLPKTNEVGFRHPGEVNLEYDNIYITTPDGLQLHGWFIKTKENYESAPTIVVFQGRAGNIGHRVPFLAALEKYCKSNLFIIGYRGYSYSEGKPTEEGIKIDSVATMNYIFSRKDIDLSKIFVLGSSMGGAVAVYGVTNSSHHDVRGVILENTFTSISDMVDVVLPKIATVKNYILLIKWESIKLIHQIKAPICFISGLNDQLIPPTHMKNLYDASTAAAWKQIIEIENGTHNETWSLGEEKYFKGLKEFMDKALASDAKLELKVNDNENENGRQTL